MIPILFDRYTTDFTTNGIGRLYDCISCTVTEERNGPYELEFEYPITGAYYSYIEHGSIIYATHDDNEDPQPFRVYSHTKQISGIVTFYASHISYKLNDIVLEPYSASSCPAALLGFENHAINENPFTFWTDKSTEAEFSISVPTAARSALGGMEGSILDVYGGEYEWDKFTVKLHASRGANTDVEIRFGKNLVDLTEESDSSGLFDGVVPYWYGEDDEGVPVLVTLPEQIVTYAGAGETVDYLANEEVKIIQTGTGVDIVVDGENINVVPLDLSDKFEDAPEVSDLRSAAEAYLNGAKGWVPVDNIKVDFVQLWQTEEYAEYAPLQRVGLCDTVSIYFPELGVIRVRQKVIKTTYNVLLDRYDEIELGELQTGLGDVIIEGLDLSQYATASDINRVQASLAALADNLQSQIDAKIETWRQSTDPSASWTTAEDKALHNGDLWCYTGTTTSTLTNLAIYQYNYDSTTQTGTWVKYDAASELFDEIDGKTTIFYGTPSGTYANKQTGDYLVDSTDGCTYRWNGSSWVKQTDYNSAIASMQSTLEAQIDGKIETYNQSADPSTAWTTAEEREKHDGDLWCYTGTTTSSFTHLGTYRFTYESSSQYGWVQFDATPELFDEIDGKTTIFYGSPSGTYTGVQTGDYLVDSSTGCTYRWSGSAWVTQTDYQSAINSMQTVLNAAITNATQKITGGLGGYVYMKPNANGYPEEILIMNTNDVSTATKVWRWNINGLGYSSSGYAGPYTTAITMDGAIVADFITTGTLNANIIKAGTLSDVGGNTTFDLATGLLTINKGAISLGGGLFSATDAGYMTARSGKIGPFSIIDSTIEAARKLRASGGNGTISLGTDGLVCYRAGSTTSDTFIDPGGSMLLGQVVANDLETELLSPDESSTSITLTNSDIKLKPGTNTFGSAPNLYLGSTGLLRKTTGSSRQIKKNIADLKSKEISADRLYDLEVVQFKYNTKSGLDKEDQRFDVLLPGFILEQMDETYPVAIDKNDSNDPKEWRWNQMYLIPPMVKLIQDQHQEIDELKEELAMIKERISALEEGKK